MEIVGLEEKEEFNTLGCIPLDFQLTTRIFTDSGIHYTFRQHGNYYKPRIGHSQLTAGEDHEVSSNLLRMNSGISHERYERLQSLLSLQLSPTGRLPVDLNLYTVFDIITAAPGRAGPRMKAVLTLYLGVSSLFAVSRTAAPGRAGPRMKAVLTLYLRVSSLFAVSRTAAPGRAGPRMKAVLISTSEISSSLPLTLTLRRVKSVEFSVKSSDPVREGNLSHLSSQTAGI
ncbi:hypothetical protein P5673_001394 [Acropora cervicornis]|uniref:Uncharacterized protein n=1 Tax=Acropora cervicornis TaxID=6130 RepID=A0AAD9VGH9_ACRCE|nr:hypothetical protein P5673_001394 [Acropora cervicornis]